MKRYYIASIFLIVTGLLLIAGIGISRSWPDDTYLLKYKLKKGQIFIYATASQTEQIIEVMGTEQTAKTKSASKVQIISEGTNDSGNIVFNMQYKSYTANASNALFDTTLTDPAELIGKKIQKEINQFGDQIKSVEIDNIKLNPIFAQAFNSDSEFLPNLPNKELKTGTPIKTTDIDSSFAMGGKRIIKSEMQYTLQGRESKAGYNCLKINYKGIITVEGDGKFQGIMKFNLEGDGDVTGTMYFAPDEGIMVAVESESQVESTAAITGQQNMTIPISSSIKSTLNLVK